MVKQGSKGGLTRIEVLVLVTACLLLAMLVPVLCAMPRAQARRVVCGANLARIGKAMFIYANDYHGALPRPGDQYAAWGPLANWLARDRHRAYGINDADPWDPRHSDGRATFSSCFYLLVKYYGAPPQLFICQGDVGTKALNLAEFPPGIVSPGCTLADLWDFGATIADATRACSYSYHIPFGLFPLTTVCDPNLAVAADRNPWLNSPGADAKRFPGAGLDFFRPDLPSYNGSSRMGRNGNAITHEEDGQNVLFLNGRVVFERRAYCGIQFDNIYTVTDRVFTSPQGTAPASSSYPWYREDSLLLHDDAKYSAEPAPGRP